MAGRPGQGRRLRAVPAARPVGCDARRTQQNGQADPLRRPRGQLQQVEHAGAMRQRERRQYVAHGRRSLVRDLLHVDQPPRPRDDPDAGGAGRAGRFPQPRFSRGGLQPEVSQGPAGQHGRPEAESHVHDVGGAAGAADPFRGPSSVVDEHGARARRRCAPDPDQQGGDRRKM